MQGVKLDFSGLKKFVTNEELEQINYKIKNAHDLIKNRSGEGAEMLGWLDLSENRDE